MKKFLIILVFLVGCIQGNIQEDITKTMTLDLPASSVSGGMAPSISVDRINDVDFLEDFKQFKDLGTFDFSITNNQLKMESGDFHFIDHVKVSLDATFGSVVLTDHDLTDVERGSSLISLPISLKPYWYLVLLDGSIKVHYVFTMSGNVPANPSIIQAKVTLHVVANINKSINDVGK